MLYRYHKNWPLELSMAICMSVDISFIMEKSKLFDQTFELQEKKKAVTLLISKNTICQKLQVFKEKAQFSPRFDVLTNHFNQT